MLSKLLHILLGGLQDESGREELEAGARDSTSTHMILVKVQAQCCYSYEGFFNVLLRSFLMQSYSVVRGAHLGSFMSEARLVFLEKRHGLSFFA